MTNPTTDLAARFEAKREECAMFEREAKDPFARQYWRGRTAALAIARDMARADAAGGADWTCAARRQGAAGGNDPADCDWPVCGCDPYADKVVSALQESGHLAPPPPAQQGSSSPITDEKEALREARDLIHSTYAEIGDAIAAAPRSLGRREVLVARLIEDARALGPIQQGSSSPLSQGETVEVAWSEHSPQEIVRRTRCQADDWEVSSSPTLWRACCDLILRRLGPDVPAPLTTARDVGTGAGDLVAYLHRQWAWSKETFGPALRTKGIVQHITKELREIEAEPHDLAEWVDVIILAMDGFWRHGGKPEDLLPAMQAKQDRNFSRTWPDWRTMGEDQAIEHDRSGEASR